MTPEAFRRAKRTDALLQRAILILGVTMAITGGGGLILAYLVVGFVQIISWLYWLTSIIRHPWGTGRIAYSIALALILVCFGLLLLQFVYPVFVFIMFTTPVMAVWYVLVLFAEQSKLKKILADSQLQSSSDDASVVL